ncbi:MAG: cadherin-like beta sandwich domain-containing protein [Nitrospirota bacterium]|nr:cadherin-like beta sandwich domain-containing protein [Nitrospirota bacterium]
MTFNSETLQPAFSSDVANYTVDVLTTVTSVTVTATPQNANASMTINGQATASGQARTITLGGAGSSTPIPIVVTAVSGSQNTYIVTVNRAALGGNNNLQSLTVSLGTLSPAFTASTTSYSVDVASTVSSVTVTATLQDTNASMMVNGQGTSSGQARTIPLNGAGSSTLVTIEVTAQNGSQKTYFVTVNRAALGGDNNLSALSVSGQTLSPAFAASTLNYTVGVASTVTSVTVTATKSDPNAVMSGSVTAGAGQATGQATISLNGPGTSTTVSILVTAVNGSQKTYTITVNRAALGGNNNLQSLTVSPGTLSPAFIASTTSYTVDVASSVGSVAVTAQAQDTGATVSINGQTTTSLSVTLNAAGTSTLVTIVVTAPNLTQKTYTVTVNRAAIVLSGNNDLSALVVSAGALVPNFDAATTNYNVAAPNSTTGTTVTATVADANATLTINGVAATSGVQSANITLVAGSNPPIPIAVTAQNGTTNTYFVTITVGP